VVNVDRRSGRGGAVDFRDVRLIVALCKAGWIIAMREALSIFAKPAALVRGGEEGVDPVEFLGHVTVFYTGPLCSSSSEE
jgi:hypothetical protein